MVLFNKKQRLWLKALCLVYALLLFYCRYRSARDPTSYFFQPEEGYRPRYSVTRIQESLRFLSSSKHLSVRPASPSTDPSLCIGIVTAKRPLAQNLNTTVGSLLDNLSQEQRSEIAVHVLFAHVISSAHPDFGQPWVSQFVDRVFTYEQLGAPIPTLKKLEHERRISEKSLLDYRLTLESCYHQTNSSWILMLEDDVVAQRHWYERTAQALQTVSKWEKQGKIRRWLYLRLFYTEKFLGWNVEDWPVYLAWSIFAISTPAVLGICARQQVHSWQGVLANSFLVVVCFIGVPVGILIYFLAGRMTVQPMRPGVHLMNRHGCCSQALLFPRGLVPLVSSYLDWKRCASPGPVDSVMEMLGDQGGLDRLAISPSLMQHVGAASYKENRPSYQWEGMYSVHGAHGVWNVEFEGQS
ncbi:uncharacterized protein ACHE_11895S [Aspergillus chevalieri]|uniref:Integral membrane protein n=1 Tax=Aspergillus chevalieri TaxID=182096 RepID=A0A7R7VGV4_ASPCH|nr:uncharacterized protein ACHE_11895S [Aspergillus chevalieri]BCR84493.1 hypothetical protein ACHE_11895S [Aspergillus chevalieri]